MTVETEDDRLTMLEDFASDHVTVNGVMVTAIYDAEYTDPLGISSSLPKITVRSSDVSGIAQGDPVTVDGRGFTVADVQDDGTGITEVGLHQS